MRVYSQEDFQLVVNDNGSIKDAEEGCDFYVKEKTFTDSFLTPIYVIIHYKLINGQWVEQED